MLAINQILGIYLESFMNPFLTHTRFKSEREVEQHSKQGHGQIFLFPINKIKAFSKELNFYEILLISWIFFLFNTFYELVGLNISWIFVPEEASFLISHFKLNLFILLLKAVLYPLTTWIFVRVWINLLKMYVKVFEVRGFPESAIQQIAHYSLCGQVLLIVPFLGSILAPVASMFFLYAGLRNNLGLTRGGSLLFICFPLILVFFLGLLGFVLLVSAFLGL